MRDAREVAEQLFKASLKASDDLGIPTNAEELARLTPILEARDREVAQAVLDELDMRLGAEEAQLTGQSAYYIRQARWLVYRARCAWGSGEEQHFERGQGMRLNPETGQWEPTLEDEGEANDALVVKDVDREAGVLTVPKKGNNG